MMCNARFLAVAGCLAAVLASEPGCLERKRVINRQTTASGKPRQLLTASREELIGRLRRQYDQVHSFNATVDMTPALGSVYKGQITEYKDIRAYVLFRKASDIRIIGLAPVVRTKVFDMVSMGQDFHILLPSQNRFVEGRSDTPAVSGNSLENLRPQAFQEAMLIPPPDDSETPLLIDNTDEDNAVYMLVLTGKTPDGSLTIDRSVFFDRTTLAVVRQKRYNYAGDILSDTRYHDWKTYVGGVPFAGTIDINRPKDGYGVVISMVKLEMNAPLGDDKFVLKRPEGTELKILGAANPPKAPAR